MNISKIPTVNNWNDVYGVLASKSLTDDQKIKYVRKNHSKIQTLVKKEISSVEYRAIMDERPLPKFRPLKNSLTKRADKKLFSIALGINYNEVDEYISNFCKKVNKLDELSPVDKKNAEIIKTYVYRHGKKDEVVRLLDYELSYAKNVLQSLYATLRYDMNGVADYFRRPIHRMDNRTMINLYNVVDKHLEYLKTNGQITDFEKEQNAKWALATIYEIQNNSKLIQAIKIYNQIK